jgi:hypothetical protein
MNDRILLSSWYTCLFENLLPLLLFGIMFISGGYAAQLPRHIRNGCLATGDHTYIPLISTSEHSPSIIKVISHTRSDAF